jgi:hypothetical protein
MQYFLIASDGLKYGPADVATLNQWASEGRLFPTSTVENATTNERLSAMQIPGLVFPSANQQPGNYNLPPNTNYPRGSYGAEQGEKELKSAWICFALSFVCCGVFSATAGIIYANKASKLGNPRAKAALIANIVMLVLGLGYLGYSVPQMLTGFQQGMNSAR